MRSESKQDDLQRESTAQESVGCWRHPAPARKYARRKYAPGTRAG